MDPPKINKNLYENTIMVVSPHGKIVQLFTPIRAVCLHAVVGISRGSTVFIEAIAIHREHKLVFRITDKWFVYSCFSIIK